METLGAVKMKLLLTRIIIFTLLNSLIACGVQETNEIQSTGSYASTDASGNNLQDSPYVYDSSYESSADGMSEYGESMDVCKVILNKSQSGWSDEEIAVYIVKSYFDQDSDNSEADYDEASEDFEDLSEEIEECDDSYSIKLEALKYLTQAAGMAAEQALKFMLDHKASVFDAVRTAISIDVDISVEITVEILIEANIPLKEIIEVLVDVFQLSKEKIAEVLAKMVEAGLLTIETVTEEIKDDAELLAYFLAQTVNFVLDLTLRDILTAFANAIGNTVEGTAKLIKAIIDSGIVTAKNLAEIIEFLVTELKYKAEDVAKFIKAVVNAGLDLTLRDILTALGNALEKGIISIAEFIKIVVNAGLVTAKNLAEVIKFMVEELAFGVKNVAEFIKAVVNAGLDLSIRDVLIALGNSINKIGDLVRIVAEAGLLTGKNLVEAFGILITDFGATAKQLFDLAIKFVLDTSPRDVLDALFAVGAVSIDNFFKLGEAILNAGCDHPLFKLSPHCVVGGIIDGIF